MTVRPLCSRLRDPRALRAFEWQSKQSLEQITSRKRGENGSASSDPHPESINCERSIRGKIGTLQTHPNMYSAVDSDFCVAKSSIDNDSSQLLPRPLEILHRKRRPLSQSQINQLYQILYLHRQRKRIPMKFPV